MKIYFASFPRILLQAAGRALSLSVADIKAIFLFYLDISWGSLPIILYLCSFTKVPSSFFFLNDIRS